MNKERIQFHIDRLAKQIENVDWQDKRIYGAYLAQTYHYVQRSTRMLALAAARFPLEQNKVHQRFLKHISEENHHERLAEHDLKALGFQVSDFSESAPLRAFYQVQYYNIEHVSAWSIMGFILALEGLAVTKGQWLYEMIARLHGPKTGAFLKVHAAEDIEHFDQACSLIEGLSENEIAEIERALETSCYLYGAMLRELPQVAHANLDTTLKKGA